MKSEVHDIEPALPIELTKHPTLCDEKLGKLPVTYRMKTDSESGTHRPSTSQNTLRNER